MRAATHQRIALSMTKVALALLGYMEESHSGTTPSWSAPCATCGYVNETRRKIELAEKACAALAREKRRKK